MRVFSIGDRVSQPQYGSGTVSDVVRIIAEGGEVSSACAFGVQRGRAAAPDDTRRGTGGSPQRPATAVQQPVATIALHSSGALHPAWLG